MTLALDPSLHALVTGINTGVLIILVLALIVPRRSRPKQPEQGEPDMRGAPPLARAAIAMGNLCAAVEQHSNTWETIEIMRVGDGQASMRITMADGEKIDPAKVH